MIRQSWAKPQKCGRCRDYRKATICWTEYGTPKLITEVETGSICILTFDSVPEAQKKTGAVTIAKAIKTNGRRVGFYWEYANKDIVQSS